MCVGKKRAEEYRENFQARRRNYIGSERNISSTSPSFDEIEREGRANPSSPLSPLLRIINGQFAASAADCIVSPFSGFPSFGCQTLSLSLSLHPLFSPLPLASAPSLSLHQHCLLLHSFLQIFFSRSFLFFLGRILQSSLRERWTLLKTCLSSSLFHESRFVSKFVCHAR